MARHKTYQQLRVELEEIVEQLRGQDLDIDEATKQYERGMELVSELEAYLKNAEIKIEKVKAQHKKPSK